MSTPKANLLFSIFILFFLFYGCTDQAPETISGIEEESKAQEEVADKKTRPEDLPSFNTITIRDTAIIKDYLKLSRRKIKERKFKECLALLDSLSSYELHNCSGQTKGTFLFLKGFAFIELNKVDSAEHYYTLAEPVLKEAYGEKSDEALDCMANLANAFTSKGRLKKALRLNEKVLKLRKEVLPELDRDILVSMNNIGRLYSYFGDHDNAINNFNDAVDLLNKKEGTDTMLLGGLYLNLGKEYSLKREFIGSLENSNKALHLLQQKFVKNDHPYLGYIMINIGDLYYYKGDINTAVEYYKKAYLIFKKSDGKASLNEAFALIAILKAQIKDEKYSTSNQSIDKIESIFANTVGTDNTYYADFLEKKAFWNMGLKNYEQAEFELKKAINVVQNSTEDENHYEGALINDLGELYLLTQQLEEAEAFMDKGIPMILEDWGSKHTDYAKSLLIFAQLKQQQKQYSAAESFFEKAINTLTKAYPTVDDMPYIVKYELITFLIAKIEFMEEAGLMEGNQSYVAILKQIIQLSKELEGDYIDEASKSKYLEKIRPIYERLIKRPTNQEGFLQSQQTNYSLIAGLKNRNLLTHITETTFLESDKISNDLIYQENHLKSQILYFDKKKHEESIAKTPNDSTLLEVTAKLFDYKRQYEALIQQIERQYPDYYDLKYNQNVISIAGIQDSLLAPNRALLEYFVGDSSIFAFLIHSEKLFVQEIKKDFPLEDWVGQLRCGLLPSQLRDTSECGPISDATAQQQYLDAAQNIYQKIIAPVEQFFDGRTELIIVPDGVLGYLPFDALIKKAAAKPSDFHLHHYLLKDYQISYAHSATLLQQMKYRQHKNPASQSFIAYAPTFTAPKAPSNDSLLFALHLPQVSSTRSTIGPLRYNIPEVEAIQAQIGGAIYTDSSATRQRFLATASDARLLHLSTHGKANDEVGDFSFLAFYQKPDSSEANSHLYNRDLYDLRLNADMVVLSACETGIGELQRGEGIISLARGFSYAGAKSIVTTLWNVDDQGSSQLMENFYGFLKKGMAKDAALKAAKLELMKDPKYASPYFWGAVIPIGDMEAVSFSAGWNWYWLLLLVPVVFLLARRRRA